MTTWNYVSETEKSNGYEDVLDQLKSYTKDDYKNSPQNIKDQIIDEVFAIYRGKNIFPIQYYNRVGILKEIQACIDKEVAIDKENKVLNLSYNQGQSLCRFLFPNMQDVVCKGVENNSPLHKFLDDHKLKRAIKFCLDHKTVNHPVVPSAIKDGLEMLGGNVATNFKSMNAKALYQDFCQEGDMVLDFSCGFGGRMMGALSLGLKYVGFEPNTETYKNLNTLGGYFKEINPHSTFHIVKRGSELPLNSTWEDKFDFAFSSPPYFNLEKYSNEDTQCYIKFKTVEDWLEGYVRPTIKNIYKCLKQGKCYAVNIADFKVGKKEVNFVESWIKISQEEGFEFVDHFSMKLQNRRGQGSGENKRDKEEGIYIFVKH